MSIEIGAADWLGYQQSTRRERTKGRYGLRSSLLKRTLDCVAMALIGPPALLIVGILALLVRLDGGPAFYCQKRIGRDGRVFDLWKLRTMLPDADLRLEAYLAAYPAARREWDLTQKLHDDPRITPIGRYLRKYSADELPQLWNVVVGQMSLVGPRPMMVHQRELYPDTAYFALQPGITGLWQVGKRNDCSFAERARRDTHYATIMSLGTDLRILLMTPLVVFRGTGL